jgi:hypothetical protein
MHSENELFNQRLITLIKSQDSGVFSPVVKSVKVNMDSAECQMVLENEGTLKVIPSTRERFADLSQKMFKLLQDH